MQISQNLRFPDDFGAGLAFDTARSTPGFCSRARPGLELLVVVAMLRARARSAFQEPRDEAPIEFIHRND